MSAATAPSVRYLLGAQPTRPAGTLTYDELQRFLAVMSAPEPIQPSEWLPIIFNEHGAGYATLEEAQLILGHIMALYNDINTSVVEERVALPDDCRVRPQALDNLDDSAPLAPGRAACCVVSSSRDLVGRALLEMKHECDA